MKRTFAGLAASFALLIPHVADAHFHVTSHTSRHGGGNNEIKTGPCGVANSMRSTNVHIFEPGEQVMFVFEETIDHSGWYHVAFDDDGIDAFEAAGFEPDEATDNDRPGLLYPDGPLLVNNIPDQQVAENMTLAVPHTYNQMVTMPNVECDNCTLQFVQVMDQRFGNVPNNANYFDCLDIRLVAAGGPDGGMAGSDAGGNTGADAGAGGPGQTVEGGCGVSGAGTSPLAGLLILIGFVALRRRR